MSATVSQPSETAPTGRASTASGAVSPALTFRALAALSFAALLLTYCLFVAPERTFVRVWLNDIMGLLDTANRIHLGQAPYKDFQLAYGPLVGLIPAWGLDLGLHATQIFGFDSLVVSFMLLCAAMAALPRRLTLPAALFIAVLVWLIAAVPMGEGDPAKALSWGCYYDRQGWAAMILILLYYVEPVSKSRAAQWTDAIGLSLLLLFECYTKFTFGAVALGFVAANAAVSKYNRAVSLRCVLLALCIAGALEAAFHFHLAYVANVAHFAAWMKADDFGWRVRMAVIGNAALLFACMLVALVARQAGRRSVFDWLYLAGCALSSILLRLSIGYNFVFGLITLVAAFVAISELMRRAEAAPSGAVRSGLARRLRWGCLLLAFAAAVPEIANRAIVLGDYTGHVFAPDALEMASAPTKLTGFIVPADKFSLFDRPDLWPATLRKHELSPSDYLRTIIEGTVLLQPFADPRRAVFTFDQVNPFPYAAAMTPPLHGFPQFWIGGLLSSDPKVLPKPEEILSHTDYVMVPKLPYNALQLETMMQLYGQALRADFRLIRQSPHWELWARKAELSMRALRPGEGHIAAADVE